MCRLKIRPFIWINFLFPLLLLTGCSHVAGNVIPEGGLTMESIYDDEVDHGPEPSVIDSSASKVSSPVVVDNTRSFAKTQVIQEPNSSDLSANAGAVHFSKLPNPELTLYVFPHLSGSEMLPVPGYWTAFSAYPREYYALPLSSYTEGEK